MALITNYKPMIISSVQLMITNSKTETWSREIVTIYHVFNLACCRDERRSLVKDEIWDRDRAADKRPFLVMHIVIQCGYIGCNTGNGGKLRISQAQLGQATWLAAA